MRRGYILIALLAWALIAPAVPVHAQSGGTINIMTPEHGLKRAKPGKHWPGRKPFKRVRARGSSNPVYPAALPPPLHYVPMPSQQVETPRNTVPTAPVVSPQTGRALPNLPSMPGAGPGGSETGQDRAMRCAHQSGVYGESGGSYLGACINQ